MPDCLSSNGFSDPARLDLNEEGEGGPMKANEIIEKVTNDLIAAIESGGAGRWKMPWHNVASAGQPLSIDGRPYRGMNVWILAGAAFERGFESNTWGTYKAWQGHDAQVRKGEKATQVLLWKPTKRKVRDDDTGKTSTKASLYARAFSVFAAEQVDGFELPDRGERDSADRVGSAEAFFDAVGAPVDYGHNHACYLTVADRIEMPAFTQFDDPVQFYGTLAHEHVHYTGHRDRLHRDLSGRFGSDAYAVEELVAELGAAFWCAQAGLSPTVREDHASYLASWLRVLKEHPRILVTVCSKAQAALDWLNEAAEPAVSKEVA